MKIVIVVLNYNTKKEILDCLDSVSELKKNGHEISVLVVDNASTDGSSRTISKKFPQIPLIQNNKNLGFAGGNNIGIKKELESNPDGVLVLNPDTIVDQNLILELVKVARSDPKIGIIGPKIYFYPGREFHKNRYEKAELGKVIWYAGGKIDWNNVLASHKGVDEVDHGQYEKEEETDFVSGAAMFVKREVFKKIGFLDERYFLYLEDLEFCQRAKQAGFKIVFAPQALVWHKNAAAAQVGSALQDYFITRNRLLFGLKYASSRVKFALIRQAISFLFGASQTKKKAVLDFFTLNFGKGSFIIQ
jgi:GT2 family glycosyltransferase